MNKDGISWRGVFSVTVTPFDRNGIFNEKDFRKGLDLAVQDGVHGIIVTGSTGEFYVLTDEERKLIFKIATDQVKGKLPLLGGTSAISTEKVIEMGKYARDIGMDGTMILPPYYCYPNTSEVIRHFEAISKNVDLPIMVYNNPRRTGININAPIVDKLADIDNIVAVKDSSKDYVQLCELIRIAGSRLRTFVGFETLLFPAILAGADGVVAMASQAMGSTVVDLYNHAVQGNIEKARELHYKIFLFYEIFDVGSPYASLKEAMNLVGRPGGYPRKPLYPLNEEESKKVRYILSKLQLV